VLMNKIVMAGSKRPHRDSEKILNLGMNQARKERARVKPAAAIRVPRATDFTHANFSVGQDVTPNDATGLCSNIPRLSIHSVSIQFDN